MKKAPDRERWIGWVALAWTIAAIAIIGGIVVISTAGFIEVPRSNSFGRMETVKEPNIFIWAIAIGQALSATMLAAIFSMINSIYQNSCDQLAGAVFTNEVSKKPERMLTKALRLTTVPATSPLSKTLSTGDMVLSFNGKSVTSLKDDVIDHIVTGKNAMTILTVTGEEKEVELEVDQDAFAGVKGEADWLPKYKKPVEGLRVASIHRASPLSGLLKEGYVLLSVNSQAALTEMDAAKAVVKGKNVIEFLNADDVKQSYSIRMEPGPLHIKFET